LNHYNFTVTNVGDNTIPANAWNVTLTIPLQCNVSNYNATFSNLTRKLTWQLGSLAEQGSQTLTFAINCTTAAKYFLAAQGTNNTLELQTFRNSTGIGCSGSSCSSSQSFTFDNPNKSYEKMSELGFSFKYNFSGYNLTIGETGINITDDNGQQLIVFQNYSFKDINNTLLVNYTLSGSESEGFKTKPHTIGVRGYAVATADANAFINITNITYSWAFGKQFADTQPMMINIEPFIFVPDAPSLEAPPNNSQQVSTPIVLSWIASTGATKYYVFGDTGSATTLLGETTVTNFLWSGLTNGVWYWRVIAGTATQNSTYSATRQFTLDLCGADTSYASALNYPMSYNNVTDTITVWGTNGSYNSYTAMGNNETNPITFEKIFEFGRAARGACAVSKPATGSYALLSRLELGNLTDRINKTFVKTTGESIDFGKQVVMYANSTLIVGELTNGSNPFSGSTLSSSGTDANSSNEGQFHMKDGSEFRLYDSILLHKTAANNSNQWKLFLYGNVKSKRSSFESWYTIRLLGANNSLEDIVLTNVGEGLYPATSQIGTLNTIKSRKTQEDGLFLVDNVNVTITSLEIAETTKDDIKVQNYNGTANLINPVINFTSINWSPNSSSIFTGKINRKFDYTLTVADSTGAAIANSSVVIRDVRGEVLFNNMTGTDGKIPTQTITQAIFDYSIQSGDARGAHLVKLKKYGKAFTDVVKEFSAATVDVTQLPANSFTTLSETLARNVSGILLYPPREVAYGGETWTSFNTTGRLNNTPITQSEFFAVFGFNNVSNNTKLTLVTDTPDANGEYSAAYDTGILTFFNNQSGKQVTPVYSYKGNVTLVNGVTTCLSMSQIYDYLQANLSDVLKTVDGVTYTSYVDLIVGNSTTGGCIKDVNAKLEFADGYTYSFSNIGGYIDLFGVTAGSGSGGGLPLNIFDDVGSSYNPGNMVYIFTTTLDSAGALVGSSVTVSVYYPNGTQLNTGSSTSTSTGRFTYNFTLPSNSPTGTYRGEIDATYTTNQVHDSVAFLVVSAGGSGSANPGVLVQVPSSITTNTNFAISALTTSSGGIPVNCDSGASLTIKNAITGVNEISGAAMTNIATGQYNYTRQTNNQSTFVATVTCTISGTEYTGTATYITQAASSGGGQALNIYADTGEFYAAGDEVAVYALTTNSSGNLVAASVNATAFYPNNSVLSNGTAVNQSLGVFKHNFTLPSIAPIGAYLVKLDANYS
ncbi:MAG: hypothetical protein HY361_05465, partial [Candidatus Aenigmarchaeota archaeon]|nr:hypothetical protein [Candidatus Aenigmarchaeota archaeon]